MSWLSDNKHLGRIVSSNVMRRHAFIQQLLNLSVPKKMCNYDESNYFTQKKLIENSEKLKVTLIFNSSSSVGPTARLQECFYET